MPPGQMSARRGTTAVVAVVAGTMRCRDVLVAPLARFPVFVVFVVFVTRLARMLTSARHASSTLPALPAGAQPLWIRKDSQIESPQFPLMARRVAPSTGAVWQPGEARRYHRVSAIPAEENGTSHVPAADGRVGRGRLRPVAQTISAGVSGGAKCLPGQPNRIPAIPAGRSIREMLQGCSIRSGPCVAHRLRSDIRRCLGRRRCPKSGRGTPFRNSRYHLSLPPGGGRDKWPRRPSAGCFRNSRNHQPFQRRRRMAPTSLFCLRRETETWMPDQSRPPAPTPKRRRARCRNSRGRDFRISRCSRVCGPSRR